MEAGERVGLNQSVLHSVCGLLLVRGLSPNGSEVWFLKWERRSRDTSQGWEREMRKVNRAPWGGQALGAPSVTQGRAPRGRTSHQPEERGDPGGNTGEGLGIFLINQGRLTNVICVLSN